MFILNNLIINVLNKQKENYILLGMTRKAEFTQSIIDRKTFYSKKVFLKLQIKFIFWFMVVTIKEIPKQLFKVFKRD